jgi:hypothetical protein
MERVRLREVAVLHSFQPIGRGLAAALPPSEFAVRVLTTAPPEAVFRPDVRPEAIEVEQVTDEWRTTVLPRLVADDGLEVVTNDELCLDLCARLRASSGRTSIPPDQLAAYTDKVSLKTRLGAAGVSVPRFLQLDLATTSPAQAVRDVVENVGLPAVVKPLRGAYNIGVAVLSTADELEAWLTEHGDEPGWQVESFAGGRLCHANAVVTGGRVTPVIVGAYTGAPLEVMRGAALGSVTVPPSHPLRALGFELLERVTGALGTAGGFVLHVEFFHDGDDAVVIDVACRAPGALVADVAELTTGVNLEEASFRLQTGRPLPEPRDSDLAAGWLWCAGRTRARTALLAWSLDFERLVADIAAAAQDRGADGPPQDGWLAEL